MHVFKAAESKYAGNFYRTKGLDSTIEFFKAAGSLHNPAEQNKNKVSCDENPRYLDVDTDDE